MDKDADRICKREGCGRWPVKGDDFCSTTCAKVFFGVVSAEQHKKNQAIHKKILARERAGGPPFIELENEHVNLPRHEGPQIRQRIKFRG